MWCRAQDGKCVDLGKRGVVRHKLRWFSARTECRIENRNLQSTWYFQKKRRKISFDNEMANRFDFYAQDSIDVEHKSLFYWKDTRCVAKLLKFF